MKTKNKIAIGIWLILFLLSTVSLFVFVHEFTHYVRFDTSEAMCFGFGGSTVGYMYHHTELTATRNFNEELIANIVAGIVCILYLIVSMYGLNYFIKEVL